jgi:HSP20 family protein
MALLPTEFSKNPFSNGDAFSHFRSDFDKFYRDLFKIWMPTDNHSQPAINLSEDDEHLVATVELPGVEKKDIKVSIEDGALIVTGEKKIEQDIKNHNWHLMERKIGAFHRSITLPFLPKTNEVDAHFENGILTVKMKKASYLDKEKQSITIA